MKLRYLLIALSLCGKAQALDEATLAALREPKVVKSIKALGSNAAENIANLGGDLDTINEKLGGTGTTLQRVEALVASTGDVTAANTALGGAGTTQARADAIKTKVDPANDVTTGVDNALAKIGNTNIDGAAIAANLTALEAIRRAINDPTGGTPANTISAGIENYRNELIDAARFGTALNLVGGETILRIEIQANDLPNSGSGADANTSIADILAALTAVGTTYTGA